MVDGLIILQQGVFLNAHSRVKVLLLTMDPSRKKLLGSSMDLSKSKLSLNHGGTVGEWFFCLSCLPCSLPLSLLKVQSYTIAFLNLVAFKCLELPTSTSQTTLPT